MALAQTTKKSIDPIWIGNRGVQETVGSPKWTITANRSEVIRIYEGIYTNLLANVPALGSYYADIGAGFIVEKYEVSNMEGLKGQMVVTMSSEGSTLNAQDTSMYEIEWSQLERALEQHHRYQVGTYALDTAQRDKIDCWKAATTMADAGTVLGKTALYAALSAAGKDFADKINRGQTTFLLFSPVARKTSRSYEQPGTNPCGYIQTPPFTVPSGYTWVKTADRASRTGRNGKWDRTEEWTGADNWDTDIYASS